MLVTPAGANVLVVRRSTFRFRACAPTARRQLPQRVELVWNRTRASLRIAQYTILDKIECKARPTKVSSEHPSSPRDYPDLQPIAYMTSGQQTVITALKTNHHTWSRCNLARKNPHTDERTNGGNANNHKRRWKNGEGHRPWTTHQRSRRHPDTRQ